MLMDLLCSKCQTSVLSLIIWATPEFTLNKEDQLESYGMFHNLTPYTFDKS